LVVQIIALLNDVLRRGQLPDALSLDGSSEFQHEHGLIFFYDEIGQEHREQSVNSSLRTFPFPARLPARWIRVRVAMRGLTCIVGTDTATEARYKPMNQWRTRVEDKNTRVVLWMPVLDSPRNRQTALAVQDAGEIRELGLSPGRRQT
jgi:hypothetical protein